MPITSYASPLSTGMIILFCSVLPLLALSMSSFIKLSVVFAILRNALGASQFPSAAICTLLALLLSAYVMQPVLIASLTDAQHVWSTSKGADIDKLQRTAVAAAKPFEAFMRKHSEPEKRRYFAAQQTSSTPNTVPADNPAAALPQSVDSTCTTDSCPGETFFSLVPAFVVSELQQAFLIGSLLFLPFLVIDIVLANLLVGLGLMMVSPTTISLPLKLLLFVACDGWFLIAQGLLQGYQ